MTEVSEKMVSDEVLRLIARCLEKVTHANNAAARRDGDPPGRLFFPAGIELIYVTFKIGKAADVTFALAGPNAKYPKPAELTETSTIVGDESGNQSIPAN
jgi:hypothetical protein